MTSFPYRPLAKEVEFDADSMCVELMDGRKIIVPLAYFPRLLAASPDQRSECVISGGGIGLHWESIDEDIRVDNLLLGIFDSSGPFYKTA
jgi:hypothetical protein